MSPSPACGPSRWSEWLSLRAPRSFHESRPASRFGWPRGDRAASERTVVDSLEKRIVRVETWLIVLAITAIAAADYFVGRETSLGPLYLIPLSYSALTHRRRTTFCLFVLCVVLRQLFGPIGESPRPWLFFFRDIGIAGFFVATVVYLNRLGLQRKSFFEMARRQRDELTREVDLAAQVQQRLIGLNQPPEGALDVFAHIDPLKGVGGDYYDFVALGDGSTGVVIADVAGKGLPAALLMPAVRIALRSVVGHRDRPSEMVAEVNRILFENTEARSYATLWFAGLGLDSGELEYVNAGHLPGLLLDARGEPLWLHEGGPPVGLMAESRYQSHRAVLEPGGVLILYTDGVTEATNESGDEFGGARLASLAQEHRSGTAKAIASAIENGVNRFLDGRARTDDTTVIVIKRPLMVA
jgi:serine phosphatase RsbU (regulator of sigma subunit)